MSYAFRATMKINVDGDFHVQQGKWACTPLSEMTMVSLLRQGVFYHCVTQRYDKALTCLEGVHLVVR
jgi:hypothetical protein